MAYMFKMQIISSCVILSVLILNILCNGQKNTGRSITFNPPEVIAVPGSCALISCTFTYTPKTKPFTNFQWHLCNATKFKHVFFNNNTKENDNGWIKMLDPGLVTNNCSFIIKNIKPEDQGEYEFRVEPPGLNKALFKPKVKISIQDEPIMNVPRLSEGEEANLTCSAPFPCPEAPPEITWWIKTRGERIIDLKDNITLTTSKRLKISTLTFTPNSDLHNATVRCDVSYGSKNISTRRTLEVMYVKTLGILGNGNVIEGDTLSLSCTVESHPPSSDPVWNFNGTYKNIFMNQTSPESLTITNVTMEHAGVYGCMRTYGNKTLNASFNINVIRNTNESKVNESFIPRSENVPQNNTRNTTGIDEYFKNLDISKILTFVAGMACSALIFLVVLCCWVSCHRGKKHKVPTANPDTKVNLEMVQTDVAQTGTNEETPLHGQFNGGNPNTARLTDGAEEEGDVGMDAQEVDYASIDYSLLKDRAPEEGEKEPTDTDYAEIKRDKRGDGKEREVLQRGDDQIETQAQMEGEEELYSNSKELKS